MQHLTDYIRSYFPVSQEEIPEIARHFQTVELPKGDFFLHAGAPCDKLAFIQSGLVRVYRQVEDKEVTQWIGTPGYFVTDLAGFVFNTPGRWQIQALTDCSLFSIDRQTYHDIAKVIPQWPEIDKLFIARCFIYLEERIFKHLHMTAEERFKQLFEESPELFNQVPLQYLASMLGMTPETLSRLRNKAAKLTS